MAQGYSTLDKEEANATIIAWEPILSDIPDDFLMPSYVMAMKNHREGPFGANDICGGYAALLNDSNRKLGEEVDRIATFSKGETSRSYLAAAPDAPCPCPPDILARMQETLANAKSLKGPLGKVVSETTQKAKETFRQSGIQFNDDDEEEIEF